MKKLISVIALVVLLAAPCFGAVAVNDNPDDTEVYVGEATTICVEGQEVTFDGSKVTMLANGHKAGVTTNVSTESNLLAAALAYGVIKKVGNDSTSDKKYSIANGTPGQMITIVITTACASSGDYVISDDSVASGVVTKTGWDDIALDAAYDSVTLLYVDDTYGWVVIGQNGASIT